ncbi:MAG: long-chain fatty acid--CoA ligase [Rhodospirillales bacterium]|nr:long-chain fatty acid--CoA ligase [Rhodospirillales bacterium]
MLGLMQRRGLLISSIVVHAARHHGNAEIVSRRDDGSMDRTNYAALERRCRRLATVLRELGVAMGDRVATLAMNSDRHLELYYAIPGIGAVCNTVNPRLAPEDIAYILQHAEDRVLFVDPGFLPLVAAIAPKLAGLVRVVVALCPPGQMPDVALPPGMTLLCYETLMAAAGEILDWPEFDENSAAGLCYTSGTTGRPKGVLYTHRSNLLHAMAENAADVMGLRAVDRLLPAVAMFHANAWGLPYSAPMAGTALILPGRQLDPDTLIGMLNAERVTVSAGVPTIWLGVNNRLRETGGSLPTLARILSGGSAFPRALMAEYGARGVHIHHAWGMTESSPLATWNTATPKTLTMDAEARLDQQATQGRTVFGADVAALDDAGAEVPWDGKTQGNLVFRGHWVASAYFRQPETSVGDTGWFPTGDVGVIDPEGFVVLTDRTKDLIKSGGEWISSIALENIAIAHPAVAEAAAIAIPDAKWAERPLLIIVPRAGETIDPAEMREFYRDKVPSWSVPDRVVIAEELPHGATGKVLKTELRKRYAG